MMSDINLMFYPPCYSYVLLNGEAGGLRKHFCGLSYDSTRELNAGLPNRSSRFKLNLLAPIRCLLVLRLQKSTVKHFLLFQLSPP